jgi:hypothetical protein
MGYDPAVVLRDVSRLLSRKPGRTLLSIAAELGIDRHTITRDLRRVNGTTFRQLQAQFIFDALGQLAIDKPMLKKEVADQLGLPSARALRVWMRRAEDRSKEVRTAPKRSQLRPRCRRSRGRIAPLKGS